MFSAARSTGPTPHSALLCSRKIPLGTRNMRSASSWRTKSMLCSKWSRPISRLTCSLTSCNRSMLKLCRHWRLCWKSKALISCSSGMSSSTMKSQSRTPWKFCSAASWSSRRASSSSKSLKRSSCTKWCWRMRSLRSKARIHTSCPSRNWMRCVSSAAECTKLVRKCSLRLRNSELTERASIASLSSSRRG